MISNEKSNLTGDGQDITKTIDEYQADKILKPMLLHLDSMLATLCLQLPIDLVKVVLKKIWEESINQTVNNMVPNIYGGNLKILNPRQLSICKMSLVILRDFLHGDGGEYGLLYSDLDTEIYKDFEILCSVYYEDFNFLKRKYETFVISKENNEFLIRLMRLHATSDEHRKWIDSQIHLDVQRK